MPTADDAVLQVIFTRQESIFTELSEIKNTLNTVAVQKNEIEHIDKDVTDLKARMTKVEIGCLTTHSSKPMLGSSVIRTVVLTSVTVVTTLTLAFTGYIIVKNLPGFYEQQKGK